MKPEMFQIGPGYVDYWIHETTHWTLGDGEAVAVRELRESFLRLIGKRDDVLTARRAFLPASVLPGSERITPDKQNALYAATHAFFLTYYSTLSAFASLLTRFRQVLGEVPHRSNAKFLAWMRAGALLSDDAIAFLELARKYRTLLDHPAGHRPFEWATIEDAVGIFRIAHYGRGSCPPGARSDVPRGFGPDPDWIFEAPDEDVVLFFLAVQLNAFFPRIQAHRADLSKMARCDWVPAYDPQSPPNGYPLFAAAEGTVTGKGVHLPELDPEESKVVAEIYERHFERVEERLASHRTAGENIPKSH